jgi:hypothetical protein
MVDMRVVSGFVGLESNFTVPSAFQERILVGSSKPVAILLCPLTHSTHQVVSMVTLEWILCGHSVKRTST